MDRRNLPYSVRINHFQFRRPVFQAMTEEAHIGSHVVAAAGPATNLGKLYRGGRVLLAVGLAAVAFSCFYERWDSHLPKAGPLLFYFHNLLGVALVVCALGIATVRR